MITTRKQQQPDALSIGGIYDLEDGTAAKLHYFSASALLLQRLDANTHPWRIVRRSDGKLLGCYRERSLAVVSWDIWFRDGSHV